MLLSPFFIQLGKKKPHTEYKECWLCPSPLVHVVSPTLQMFAAATSVNVGVPHGFFTACSTSPAGTAQSRCMPEPHPSVLKSPQETPTSGRESTASRWKQDLRHICCMCSQHKVQHGDAQVSSPEVGSISSQLRTYLELVVEVPLNLQDQGILPVVTGQMEVPLSTALPQFCNVYF